MGTSLELRVRADDAEAARRAEARVLGEIDRLSAIFSGYDPSSEFRRWQAAPRRPDEGLRRSCSRSSGPATTGGPRAAGPSTRGCEALLAALVGVRRARTGCRPPRSWPRRRPSWPAPPGGSTPRRARPSGSRTRPLSLDAIAKGYIVERACDAAMRRGRGRPRPPAERRRRPAGLRRGRPDGRRSPRRGATRRRPSRSPSIEVRDRAVATSGRLPARASDRRPMVLAHPRPPDRACPADGVAGATVIAARSADADALATILNVLAARGGRAPGRRRSRASSA